MKHCPKCDRTYVDEMLNFCLDDGEWLQETSESAEPQTAIMAEPTASAGGQWAGEAATRSHGAKELSGNLANNRKLVLGVLGVLLVAAVGVGSYWLYGNRTSKQIDSIAVMPFVNESGDPEMEYLSDGMTETLISTLIQLPDLTVKARSSVFRYKGKEMDAPTIGKELNVQAILNGRVVQRNDGLTLYLELVDSLTGNRIWGEQYDRKQSDLVSLQREVARDVASKLHAKLTSADQQKLAKNYTSNPEAYQLYLKGISYWNKRGPKNIEIAIGYFQQAIDIDPNYALAYAGLADAYAQPSQQPQGRTKAREAALRALSLDNMLPEAHGALGGILARFDLDFVGAESELRRALELNPNSGGAHCRYGRLLTQSGRFESAEAEYIRGLELEPESLICNLSYGTMLTNARRYDEAVKQLKKTLELDENFFLAHGNLATVYQAMGNFAECVNERVRGAELNGNEQLAARMRESFAKAGWEGFLRFMAEEGRQVRTPSYFEARYYAALGEKDKAFAALNNSYEERNIDFPTIKVDPLLDPLRDDPRFAELIKKIRFQD